MADEAFTTYPYVADPGSDFTTTNAKIDATGMLRNTETVIADDFGVNFRNGDFTEDIDVQVDSTAAASSNMYVWGWANRIASPTTIDSTLGDVIAARLGRSGANFLMQIEEILAGSSSLDTYISGSGDLDTIHYCRVNRTSTAFTCKIYPSDADRTADTNIIDTLTLTLGSVIKYRHRLGAASRNDGNTQSFDGFTANHDINPVALGAASVSGTIKDRAGTTIDCSVFPVLVNVYDLSDNEAPPVGTELVTAANGAWSVGSLAATKYRVTFEYANYYSVLTQDSIAGLELLTAA